MARGRGTATGALERLSRWGFEELGVQRLEVITDPDNLPEAVINCNCKGDKPTFQPGQ